MLEYDDLTKIEKEFVNEVSKNLKQISLLHHSLTIKGIGGDLYPDFEYQAISLGYKNNGEWSLVFKFSENRFYYRDFPFNLKKMAGL